MRKKKKGRKLSRKKDQRKALIKSLISSLVLKEKIKTTEAKAKEASRLLEKFITKAKKNNLSTRRYLGKFFSERITNKLFELGSRYQNRNGGYLRILKSGLRKSDGAKMVIVELIKI